VLKPSAAEESTPMDHGYGHKVQHAVDAIRHKIANGELRPGHHLRQDDVAASLGLSRVPVREAFKILVAEQMLVHERNRGHYVAELTAAEMADICWLRETLEAELARTAQVATPATIAALEDLNGRIEGLLSTDEIWQRVELDGQFHELLWHLSERPVVIQDLKRIAERQRPYRVLLSDRVPDRDHAAIEEHREIIAALRAVDLPRYQALLTVHIARARELVALLGEHESGTPGT